MVEKKKNKIRGEMRNMDNWQLQLRKEGGKKDYREETHMLEMEWWVSMVTELLFFLAIFFVYSLCAFTYF